MHIKDIKITSSFNIANRGRGFITNLDYDLNCHKFHKGDTFRKDDKIYEVLSVEAANCKSGEKMMDFLSFIAKEITPTEFFTKVYSLSTTHLQ